MNDIGQFLDRGHVVCPLSKLSSVEWPSRERMLVITGHGDTEKVAGYGPDGIASLIASSAVPQGIPIVLLSCDSARDRGDGTNFTKDVYEKLGGKRTITGFKGSAILDARGPVMKIVSIAHKSEEQVGKTQTELEKQHDPQGDINKTKTEDYKEIINLRGVKGFFNDFLTAIQGSIDPTGCVTYHRR